ncbi:MAG: DnaJ C-terminal domain-containing protein [Polyangiaceae bacterium]
MPDPYAVLGVSKDASQQDIKRAYKKLASKLHPDKNPGKKNEERFKEVTGAYEVLGDESKRRLYDEFGEISLRPGFDAEQARAARNFSGFSGRGPGGAVHFDLGDIFGGGGGNGFGDVLGDMFRRRGGPGVSPARRGQDVMTTVKISFADAVRGTTVRLSPRQGGEAITVRIPAGADEGNKVRVRGKGADGIAGGPPGDLLLAIEVEPHPHFTREGNDLHLDLPLTIVEAYRGAQVKVPTPGGEVKLTVPKGVQSGQKLRLRGKGVAPKGAPPGDLYVRFMVMYPTDDDEEVVEAIDRLAGRMDDPRAELVF